MSIPLILASSSPYRRAQLRQLGLTPPFMSPDIDESPLPGESAGTLAQRLAREKAAVILQQRPDSLVLGGDQAAECNGQLIGKPGTLLKAREQLRMMSGQLLHFHSAYCLLGRDQTEQDCIVTEVKLRQLNDTDIEHYLEVEPALDCAGSFKIEGYGITLFDYVRSSDPSALTGLPLISLSRSLRAAGVLR